MNYAIVTSAGLNTAAQASENGHFIKINRFIPVYDYRIDENIIPDPTGIEGWSVNEISSVEGFDATYPTGERLWKDVVGAYSLTDADEFWVVSAAGAGGTGTITISSPKHNISMPVNLRNGVPMWDWVSADNADLPGQSSTAWILYNAVTIANNDSTNNPQTTTDRSKYFTNITYGAFLGSDGRSRGSWQARINEDVGQFKFNKIALYAVQVDSNGTELSGESQEPTLFAMVIFPTQIKTNFREGGVDDVVVDFQLDISPTAIDFNNLLYGTSGDYWMPVEVSDPVNELSGYGLHFNGDIFISHAYRPEDFCAGKMVISTQHNIVGSLSAREREMPQIALQYINNSGSETIRKRVTMMCTISGDLFIDASTYGSGLVKIRSNGNKPSIDIDDSLILLGGVDGIFIENQRTGTSGLGVRIEEPDFDTSKDAAGHFTGGDLIRKNQPLIITTKNGGSTDDASDMWIVAGLIFSGSNALDTIQTSGDTHEAVWEVLNGVATNNIPTENVGFRSSRITILGLGGINIQGKKIHLVTEGTDENSVFVKGNVAPLDNGQYALGSSIVAWNNLYVKNIYGDQNQVTPIIQLHSSIWPSHTLEEDGTYTVDDINFGDKQAKFNNMWARYFNGFSLGEWIKSAYDDSEIDFTSSNVEVSDVNGNSSSLTTNKKLEIANVSIAHIGANTVLMKLQLKGLVLKMPAEGAGCYISIKYSDNTKTQQSLSNFFGVEKNLSLEFLNFRNNESSPSNLAIDETIDLVVSNHTSTSLSATTESDHTIVGKPYGPGSLNWDQQDIDNTSLIHRVPHIGTTLGLNDVVPIKVHATWYDGDIINLSDLENWTITNIISNTFSVQINTKALIQLKRVIEIGSKPLGDRSTLEQQIMAEFNTFWPQNVKAPTFRYGTNAWENMFKGVIGNYNGANLGSESIFLFDGADIGFKHRTNQVFEEEQYWGINTPGVIAINTISNYVNQENMRTSLPNSLMYDPDNETVTIIPDSINIVRERYTGTLAIGDAVPSYFAPFYKAERTDDEAISFKAPVAWYNVVENQKKSTIFGREEWVCRTNNNNDRRFDIERFFDDSATASEGEEIRTNENGWGITSETTQNVNTMSGWSWLVGGAL